MNYNKIYKKTKDVWGRNLNKLLQIVWKKVESGCVFLDLGCGQGRDSLFMARKGFNVVAVDASTEGIDSLNLAAKKYNLDIRIACQDIKNFKIEKDNYTIINIFNTLHFLEKKDALKIIEKVKKNLKQGGFVAINDFTTQDPLFEKERNKTKGFFQPQELSKLFSNFSIVLYRESSVADPGHSGFEQSHCHQIVELIAQKASK